MPNYVAYLAFLFGATICEYRHILRICFSTKKERDEALEKAQLSGISEQFKPEYWKPLDCYALRVI